MRKTSLVVAIICLMLLFGAWLPYLLLWHQMSVARYECRPQSDDVQCVLLEKTKRAAENHFMWALAVSAPIVVIGGLVILIAERKNRQNDG